MNPATLVEKVGCWILFIRGHKVLLDSDLAELYGVKPIRLREQVKRNRERFPRDFMFQLSDDEVEILVSQNAIPSRKHLGGHLPYVFTQEGIAMLSSVLNSERAIQVNIAIMRAFVKLRQMIAGRKHFAEKLAELERRLEGHDTQVHSLFETIRQLMAPPKPSRRRIGFRA